ncbi:MAG: ABC transporter ATP-binding protein [Anaerolineaceae bacterium]
MIIQTQSLTKQYKAGVFALRDVNFAMDEGVYGLLGPNGAGKTTLIGILAGLIQPTAGRAIVCGYDTQHQVREVRKNIGIIPQEYLLYPDFSAYEFLDYMALLSGVDLSRREIMRLLEEVNLAAVAKKKIKSFSGGMKQRLVVAQALVHDPPVLFADEPTTGLDPEERVRFRNLFSDLGLTRTVLLSTHITEDITATTNRLSILHMGRLVFSGSIAELLAQCQGMVWGCTVARADWPAFKDHNLIFSFVHDADAQSVSARYSPLDSAPAGGGTPLEPNLEDAYMLLISQRNAEQAR